MVEKPLTKSEEDPLRDENAAREENSSASDAAGAAAATAAATDSADVSTADGAPLPRNDGAASRDDDEDMVQRLSREIEAAMGTNGDAGINGVAGANAASPLNGRADESFGAEKGELEAVSKDDVESPVKTRDEDDEDSPASFLASPSDDPASAKELQMRPPDYVDAVSNKFVSVEQSPSSSPSKRNGSGGGGATGFLRAARAGNVAKMMEYMKVNSFNINVSNANGLNALHLASKEGHLHIVKMLLERGADVDSATARGNTSLHIASLAGQVAVVKTLIENGAKVNGQSTNGFTPLYMAAQENHVGVVEVLLQHGANQSLTTADGFTPLAVALQQGHEMIVALLLENDSKGKVKLPALHIAAKKDDCRAADLLLQKEHFVDVQSRSGFTPLHIAAHYGNAGVGAILVAKGAKVDFLAKQGIAPLHVAAKWGKMNMVKLLLENSADKGIQTRDGLTPLHCASRSGHDQVVDYLIENDAPLVCRTKNGLAPLHMAAQGDHVECARLLLYHKAYVDDVTVDYLTPLHVAAHCGHHRVAKILLDRKAEVNARALNGFTPLHIACKKNRIKVVELLVKYGALIEATTESGLTPLHVASFMGCLNIVVYLIQHGSNPNIQTVRGETPLHLATRANQVDIIRVLLRHGAEADAQAREQTTALHIASRMGNRDVAALLLQHGAKPDSVTKDNYTSLHLSAKEGHDEVTTLLLDHGASLEPLTRKGLTPLHVAAKYGHPKVASLLLMEKQCRPDVLGKNNLTPLHVAVHCNHPEVASLLLDRGASPHAAAKNGYTPLHISSKKNQIGLATSLLEHGAKPDAESVTGITPIHLASQEGHAAMVNLLLSYNASVDVAAKNGLTPMHLCAQEDRVGVAAILKDHDASIDPTTKAGYTPLHTASHFGQINMVRFLLKHGASVTSTTKHGYTALHQAAQQGHVNIVDLLLASNASPDVLSKNGQTPYSIAERLGYISVAETLKAVTNTPATAYQSGTVSGESTPVSGTSEKYRIMFPETMQESHMMESEDEAENEALTGDASYPFLTSDDIRIMPDDSAAVAAAPPQVPPSPGSAHMGVSVSMCSDDLMISSKMSEFNEGGVNSPLTSSFIYATPIPPSISIENGETGGVNGVYVQGLPGLDESNVSDVTANSHDVTDNIDISRASSQLPIHAGFLVSFMVDARGGAMRGCRHSGVRVVIPPRCASMPTRVTCRMLRKDKLAHPPPLMEGEALASRIVEMGPVGTQFLGPVVLEVPHFASLRGREREIMILRSNNGETWREHTTDVGDDVIQEILNGTIDGEELEPSEELVPRRVTRILTTEFPQYFAVVTRVRQESATVSPEGGMLSSTVVPQVQAVFPHGALTKKIKMGLQAQPIPPELVSQLLGNRVAVSPIVTVEPRRRKFHKPITLTIPLPQAAGGKGMINGYNTLADGGPPTLRLLCSITGGTTPAQWEDITGTTPLTFINDCVSFMTTISARFWLMDCQNVNESAKMATELYREAITVPFMAKFVVFAKRQAELESRLRVFCMTDDKMDKTLESQEHFKEVAMSRDVEVLESKRLWVDMIGNLIPVTKSRDGEEQLNLVFRAFKENRLPLVVRVRDPDQEAVARISFMPAPKHGKPVARTGSNRAPLPPPHSRSPRLTSQHTHSQHAPLQTPACTLNLQLPDLDSTVNSEAGDITISEEKQAELMRKFGLVMSSPSPNASAHSSRLHPQDTSSSSLFPTPTMMQRAELKLSDIAECLQQDWINLSVQLGLSDQDILDMQKEYRESVYDQALASLHCWYETYGHKATGNVLEKALKKIHREDIVQKCMYNVQTVTDEKEKQEAKKQLIDASGANNQCGFEGSHESEDDAEATLKRRKEGRKEATSTGEAESSKVVGDVAGLAREEEDVPEEEEEE